MIGIVGGVGPYAGLDLMRKVFDQTLAGGDQEHVDALLFSLPSGIADRTEYLEGRVEQNPPPGTGRGYRVRHSLQYGPCSTHL